jgi:hypothetical protein
MDKRTPKSQTRNLLDSASAEDLAKIEEHQASTDGAYPVDNEWLLLAEFAKAYGWQAYLDARDDKIGMPEMLTLVEANRKLQSLELYRASLASLIGSGSAQAKKPSSAFKSMTKDMIKQAKVKE